MTLLVVAVLGILVGLLVAAYWRRARERRLERQRLAWLDHVQPGEWNRKLGALHGTTFNALVRRRIAERRLSSSLATRLRWYTLR